MSDFSQLVILACQSRVWVKGGDKIQLVSNPNPTAIFSTRDKSAFLKDFVQKLKMISLVKEVDVSKAPKTGWSWGTKAGVAAGAAAVALVVGNMVYMYYKKADGTPYIEALGSWESWKDGPMNVLRAGRDAFNSVCGFFFNEDGSSWVAKPFEDMYKFIKRMIPESLTKFLETIPDISPLRFLTTLAWWSSSPTAASSTAAPKDTALPVPATAAPATVAAP